ncbi:MAG: hypothetical protein R3B06_22410 [Kofleriaceae bacterium]
MTDDDRLDLDGWAAPPVPPALVDRVLTTVRGRPVEVAPRPPRLRAWQAAVVGGAVIAAAGIVVAVWPRTPPRSAGRLTTTAPTATQLADGTDALAEAGVEFAWDTAHGLTRVDHAAGTVTYRQTGDVALTVTTPAGVLASDHATFRVEVPMKRELAIGAAGAAIATLVVVSVYEGRVTATPAGAAPQTIAAGNQVTLSAGDPPPPPPVVTVARAERNQARRDEVARAIAASRVRPRPMGGGVTAATIGGAAPAAAPVALSKDDIRAGVKDVAPMLGECFDAELARDPALGRSTVTVHFTIDSAADIGTVVTAGDLDIPGVLGQSADFRECLGATLEAMVLPPLGDGGQVEVTYPFVFAPTEDEAETDAPAAHDPDDAPDDQAPAAAPRPRRTVAAEKPRPAPPADTAAPPPGQTARDLIIAAQSAAMNSQYQRALALAEKALQAKPSKADAQRAVSVAALSACRARQRAKAKTYYERATVTAKNTIRAACLHASGFDPAP